MSGLNETPRGNRTHIAFFGLRNAGKSTLVNAFTGQEIAIVSDVPGTTTDPVSKAMEILPLGPCLITDTAGLDDEGELGLQRVRRSLQALATADIAVWVWGDDKPQSASYVEFIRECKQRKITILEYHRGDSVLELKQKIASIKLETQDIGLLDGLVKAGDRIVCVVPIDESAPKGRLILPQQQVIRECLDRGAICTVCQPSELPRCLQGQSLVITDSQAFHTVKEAINLSENKAVKLTSFSILFARQKGDLSAYMNGLAALEGLADGDTVLIAEGCTHHRQCNDIGAVKIPKALKKLTGKNLRVVFSSGNSFFDSVNVSEIRLVVHCGGCMLSRREVLRRIDLSKEHNIPIVNYGMLLAAANGIKVEEVLV